MQRILAGLIFLSLMAVPPVWGLDLAPFAVRNLSPPALPQSVASSEPARINPPGQVSMRLSFDLASNASLSTRSNENVHLDGETSVTTLGLRYGLAERLQIGIDVPWISHNQGELDSFIRNWHDFFGLPNGDRNDLPDNELRYGYAAASGEGFLLEDQTSGLGDVRIFLAWQWLADKNLAASLHGSVKAPVGDAGDLTGNEAWGASLALSGQRDYSLAKGKLSLWGGLAATWLGNGNLLGEQSEDWAASGWAGIGWSPMDWLAFKLQADGHSELYDSELSELGDPALILTMGGSLGLGQRTTLDIGVGEDLSVNASPDVTFHLSLVHNF